MPGVRKLRGRFHLPWGLMKPEINRPQFEPISQRSPAVVAGALLWVLAIVVVLWVIGHRNAVEIAFAVTFGSILIWTVLLAAGRIRRGYREREP